MFKQRVERKATGASGVKFGQKKELWGTLYARFPPRAEMIDRKKDNLMIKISARNALIGRRGAQFFAATLVNATEKQIERA